VFGKPPAGLGCSVHRMFPLNYFKLPFDRIGAGIGIDKNARIVTIAGDFALIMN
jgi:hypothetical protein